MQHLTCAVGSVCSLPLLLPASQPVRPQPSPAQPNSSSSAQASFITRCTINASITSNPDTHYTPLRYPDLVILQAVIHPGRRLWTCTLSKPRLPTFQLRTCTGGSRNPRPSQQPQRRTYQGRDLSRSEHPPPTPHHTTKYLNMATRGPPGARGMGNRFAQFKLVLLGMFLYPEWRRPKLRCVRMLTTLQESLPSERYCPPPLPSNTSQHCRR